MTQINKILVIKFIYFNWNFSKYCIRIKFSHYFCKMLIILIIFLWKTSIHFLRIILSNMNILVFIAIINPSRFSTVR